MAGTPDVMKAAFTKEQDFFATRAENRALIHSHHDAQNGRIQVWMGLEHLFYCTADAYREALECQAEYGVGIHTHASEQKEETVWKLVVKLYKVIT